MNRFHESEWILRSYGYIRYAYKLLTPAQLKSFISDALFHSYVIDNFRTPYKKSIGLFLSWPTGSTCIHLYI